MPRCIAHAFACGWLAAVAVVGVVANSGLAAAQSPPSALPPSTLQPTTLPPSTLPLAPTDVNVGRDAPQTAAEFLSTAWLQRSLALLADPDISDEGLEAVLDLSLACGALTPDRAAPWRVTMYLADQLETSRPDLALSARRTALANLARLEPANDSVTLSRLTDAIESHGTAEERVRAYEQLLDPANASRLGTAVRSRLAYQLAMLQNRMGNTDLFARWLGESVKISPAFPQATMAAAGFFRTRVNDPVADVELFSLAVEANPRNLQAWSALITVLLDNAAYKAAERATRDALAVAEGDRHWGLINILTCALAVALWGKGRRDEAQRELANRLRIITEDYRRMLQFTDATLTPERIRAMFPPLPAGLSLNSLALAQGRVDEETLERMTTQALALTQGDVDLLRQQGLAASLSSLLDKATISLLFKKDPNDVPPLLADTAKEKLLTDAVQSQFQGLLDWRGKKYPEALAALEATRHSSPLAQFGYASVLAESGRTAEAAREYHEIAKQSLGTTIGLMALDRLAGLLKVDSISLAQLDSGIAERARAMDDALEQSLSPLIDDMMAYPMRMLSVVLEQTTPSPGPYSWLAFKITIRNLSRMPLAIGRSDPIISKLVLRAEAPRSAELTPEPIPPAVVPFDPALEIPVGGQIDFTIDAMLTPLGRRLVINPLDTHVISPSVLVNPRDSEYGPMPAFMGSVTALVPFMVSGVAVTPQWVAESIRMLGDASSVNVAYRIVLLAHAAASPETAPEAARAVLASPDVWKAMADAWPTLEPTEQAWVVASLPLETPAMAPLLDVIRSNTNPTVIASWVLARVKTENDPMLDVARRTGDPRLERLAEAISWIAKRRAERAIEQLGVGGGSAPGSRP